MSLNEFVLAASESEPEVWAGANPYVVAALVLLVFFGAMGILVAFGGGREHS